jgi:hypothetical protein
MRAIHEASGRIHGGATCVALLPPHWRVLHDMTMVPLAGWGAATPGSNTMPVTNRDWFHRITFAAILSLVASISAILPLRAQERPTRLLYFTHSAGYRHDVIPASRDILKQIGAAAGFEVTASEDVAVFTAENLQRYGAVMFFTTGELPMSNAQQHAFTDFIRAGNGFLGVHSATERYCCCSSLATPWTRPGPISP